VIVNLYTLTGSHYRLDSDAMTWERLVKSGESGELRTEHGEIRGSFPSVFDIGSGVAWESSPAPSTPPDKRRAIYTSDLVSVDYEYGI